MEESSDSQGVYAINGPAMEDGIRRWLTPVVDDLKRISGGYTQSHADVAAAHDSEAAGWFGEQGNVEVRWASSSFLNATEWQLRQLTDDAAQLAASLEEYRAMLLEHINAARAMDERNAERFRAIEGELGEGPGW